MRLVYQDHAARIPVHLEAALNAELGNAYSLELAASSGGSHIQVWETADATEPLNNLPHAYTLEALSAPVTVYVSGCQPNNCGPGEVKLEWRLLQHLNDGSTKIRIYDVVSLLIVDTLTIDGDFRVFSSTKTPAPYYEVGGFFEVEEGGVSFFRTLAGMRIHLKAVTLPGVAVDSYTWLADQGHFFDGYGLNATELTGEALTGSALSDIYWDMPEQPAGDAEVQLVATITQGTGPTEITSSRRFKMKRSWSDMKVFFHPRQRD